MVSQYQHDVQQQPHMGFIGWLYDNRVNPKWKMIVELKSVMSKAREVSFFNYCIHKKTGSCIILMIKNCGTIKRKNIPVDP